MMRRCGVLSCGAVAGKPLPKKAKVVIVGGGVIGNSVAYQLGELGWGEDVVLLERNELTSGTTWHAAGLIGQLRGTSEETMLSSMGATTFRKLLEQTEQDTGFKQTGSISLSRSQERTHLLKRNKAKGELYGIPVEIITPGEAKEFLPFIDETQFDAAMYLPNDGCASPTDVTMAFNKGARMHGAQTFTHTKVTGFVKDAGRVRGVKTNRGDIECEYVINCAGLWANDLARQVGVNVPLHACEHFYIVTDPIQGVTTTTPLVRDPDRWAYWREWGGGFVIGAFEKDAKPCFVDGVPDDFAFQLLEDDYDHFYPILEAAMEAIPDLEKTPIRNMVNGPESFTPDNQYILGEAPEVGGFWVAAGMNSSGIASSAGAGWALANWMVNGAPPMDLTAVDINRFPACFNSKNFVRQRSAETLGMHYRIPYPRFELVSGRPLQSSPLYETLKSKGAIFGSKFGFERVNYFAPSADEPQDYTFGRPLWMQYAQKEYEALRDDAVVFDMSSFAKFTVMGKDAGKFCNHIFGAEMVNGVQDGAVIYTAMLNKDGGYESDCTVTKISDEEYYVVSPTTHGTKDFVFMRKVMRAKDFAVGITDVSSKYVVLSVQGNKAMEILPELKDTPQQVSEMVEIDTAWVRALRVSYVGDKQGTELHVPVAQAASVYKSLMARGNGTLKDAGYYLIESMRVAYGYRAWGHEMLSTTTPVEAGTGFALKKDKPDAIYSGAFATREVKDRIVSFVVRGEDKKDVMLWGGEVLKRDGVTVGLATSATYLFPLSRLGGMAEIKKKIVGGPINKKYLSGGDWTLVVGEKEVPIDVSFKTPIAMCAEENAAKAA
eukprot:TRINITY_DN2342_c0_g3_i2.p1 TRINITY_DN2342_c0_g3~~TRINITY_DN2342_c0_g3_i2.p1  ORF type:complete len:830 (+),score=315.13 TRINITY_DN2342_c0_g3_i2:89-2578(+)